MLKDQRFANFELNVEVGNSKFTSAFSTQHSEWLWPAFEALGDGSDEPFDDLWPYLGQRPGDGEA
jgi:hypothetical protein